MTCAIRQQSTRVCSRPNRRCGSCKALAIAADMWASRTVDSRHFAVSHLARSEPLPISPDIAPYSARPALHPTADEKAEAVHTVFHQEYDPKRYSAQMVSHHGPKGHV